MGANAHAGAGASFSDRAALAPAGGLTHRAAVLPMQVVGPLSREGFFCLGGGPLRSRTTESVADGHTVSNAPDLFRPPKLSGTGPG